MVFNLSAVGSAQADDSSHRTTVHKSDVIQNSGFGRKRDHPAFAIFKSPIDPDQCHIPIQMGGQSQGQAMLDQICGLFMKIEIDVHRFNVATLIKLVNATAFATPLS